jgi:hypothetical protein
VTEHSVHRDIPDRLPSLAADADLATASCMSVLEAAAWLAGPQWSAATSVHPAVASVARWVSDRVGEDDRQFLWPLILESVGTARPCRPLVSLRLRRQAHKAISRAEAGDPRSAWEEILQYHRRITGGQSPPRRG